jgi:hypothetical protein
MKNGFAGCGAAAGGGCENGGDHFLQVTGKKRYTSNVFCFREIDVVTSYFTLKCIFM